FFQAEDGIRDLTVTGVQTCALPISSSSFFIVENQLRAKCLNTCSKDCHILDIKIRSIESNLGINFTEFKRIFIEQNEQEFLNLRSEERRVGKECRFRLSTYS